MSRLRTVLALCAFFVFALALSACGGDDNKVPGNAVAVVDGEPITRAEYEHWARITVAGASATGDAVVPDPPNFTRCVAALRRVRPARGQPRPSETTLRAQCRQQNEQLVQQTMGTLIQSQWIVAEAEEQGVEVSDADVQRQLRQTKRQSFPNERAYQRFLDRTGMTQEDVLFRLRTQLLAQRLTEKIQRSVADPTDAEIAEFYSENRAQFSLPERRDLELILTRTEARANEAKAAIQNGTSWAAAAKRYSTDDASKATGGVLRGVARGQQDRALDRAAFAADRGEIVGPIKGQFGWYLVRVRAVTAPKVSTLREATPQIRPVLQQQAQQRKMQSFSRNFTRRWTDATNCRTGYIVPLCSNAPRQRTTSTGGTVATTPSQGDGE